MIAVLRLFRLIFDFRQYKLCFACFLTRKEHLGGIVLTFGGKLIIDRFHFVDNCIRLRMYISFLAYGHIEFFIERSNWIVETFNLSKTLKAKLKEF